MSNALNRRKRRELARQKLSHKDLREITEHNINAGIQQGAELTINVAVESYSVAIAYVMHYKMRYGETKCKTTMRQIQEVFEQLNKGELDLDKMKEDLERDVNIIFGNGE